MFTPTLTAWTAGRLLGSWDLWASASFGAGAQKEKRGGNRRAEADFP